MSGPCRVRVVEFSYYSAFRDLFVYTVNTIRVVHSTVCVAYRPALEFDDAQINGS